MYIQCDNDPFLHVYVLGVQENMMLTYTSAEYHRHRGVQHLSTHLHVQIPG